MKEIQSVYIDTTFCVPQAMFIPSRDDTTSAAVGLINDWLSRSHGNHIIHLQYRADLGYENLFVRFSLEFNMKVSLLPLALPGTVLIIYNYLSPYCQYLVIYRRHCYYPNCIVTLVSEGHSTVPEP